MNQQIQTNRKPQKLFNREDQISLFVGDLLSHLEFHGFWTENEVIDLQMGMIEIALKEINDKRKSQEMRKEAWDWIMNDDDLPFSSRECAIANDLDIENLRSMLRRLINDI